MISACFFGPSVCIRVLPGQTFTDPQIKAFESHLLISSSDIYSVGESIYVPNALGNQRKSSIASFTSLFGPS